MNINTFAEAPKKYEEKFLNIMSHLGRISSDNPNTVKDAESRLQQEMMEFEKLIDEENINRINAAYKINMGLIAKLKETGFDFNLTRNQPYEKIISNLAENLKHIGN